MLNVRLLSVSRPSLSNVASHFPPNFGSAKKHSAKCVFPPTFSPSTFSPSLKSLSPAAVSPPFSPQIFRPISSSRASFRCHLFHFPFSIFRRRPSSPISDRTLPPFSGQSPPRFSGRFPAAVPAFPFSIFQRRPSSTKLPYVGQNLAPIFRPISSLCRRRPSSPSPPLTELSSSSAN
jgi:hypothetical protein